MSRKLCLRILEVLLLVFLQLHNVYAKAPISKKLLIVTSSSKTSNEKLSPNSNLALSPDDLKKYKIWSNGVIPYYADLISYDSPAVSKINNFLSYVNRVTGVHFGPMKDIPKNKKDRFVIFINRNQSMNCDDLDMDKFTNEGSQEVVLGYNCISNGDLSRVVLAILGLSPQHNSPERDEYFNFQRENVIPDKAHLFNKINNQDWLFDKVPYDTKSASHYGYHQYSKNGHATLKPKQSSIQFNLGEANFLSMTDIQKIKMIYGPLLKNNNIKSSECRKMFIPGKQIYDYKTSNQTGDTQIDVFEDETEIKDKGVADIKLKKMIKINLKDKSIGRNKGASKKKKVNYKYIKERRAL